MLAQIQRKRPTLRQWIMDTGSSTNIECTFFEMENKPTQGIWSLAFWSGGHAIYWPKYKCEEKVF